MQKTASSPVDTTNMTRCCGYVSNIVSTDGDTPVFEFKQIRAFPANKNDSQTETYDEKERRLEKKARSKDKPRKHRLAVDKSLPQELAVPPLRVSGWLPSMSPFVYYDLLLTKNTGSAGNTFMVSHIKRVRAPTRITALQLRTTVLNTLTGGRFRGIFCTPVQRMRIQEYFKRPRDKSNRWMSIEERPDYTSLEQIKQIDCEDLLNVMQNLKLLDNLFKPQLYFQLFRFMPMRDAASWPEELLARKLGHIRNHPVEHYLKVFMSHTDMKRERISDAGFRELEQSLKKSLSDVNRAKVAKVLAEIEAAKPFLPAAREWTWSKFWQMRHYGTMRFDVPDDPGVCELLEQYGIIIADRYEKEHEKNSDADAPPADAKDKSKTTLGRKCSFICALELVNELVGKIASIETKRFLSVTTLAPGIADLTKFCEGKQTLIVSASDYTQAQLARRTPVPVYRLHSLLNRNTWLWKKKHRGRFDTLVLHAADQMGIEEVNLLLDYATPDAKHPNHCWKAILIMADLRNMPPSPVLGVGHFTQELLKKSVMPIEQAEEPPKPADATPNYLHKCIEAAIHQRIDMMKFNKTLTEAPGVTIHSQADFENSMRILMAKPNRNPFKQQILCEHNDTREAVHKLLFGEDFSRSGFFLNQLVRYQKDDVFCSWRISRLYQKVNEKEHNASFAEADKNIFCDLVSDEAKSRTIRRFNLANPFKVEGIDVDLVTKSVRRDVDVVYYILHPKLSSAKSIYSALSMTKKHCIFVGEVKDFYRALSKTMAYCESFRCVSFGKRSGLPETEITAVSEEKQKQLALMRKRQGNAARGKADEEAMPLPADETFEFGVSDDPDDQLSAALFMQQQQQQQGEEQVGEGEGGDDDEVLEPQTQPEQKQSVETEGDNDDDEPIEERMDVRPDKSSLSSSPAHGTKRKSPEAETDLNSNPDPNSKRARVAENGNVEVVE